MLKYNKVSGVYSLLVLHHSVLYNIETITILRWNNLAQEGHRYFSKDDLRKFVQATSLLHIQKTLRTNK